MKICSLHLSAAALTLLAQLLQAAPRVTLEPPTFGVDQPAVVRIRLTADRPLSSGTTIAFAMPASWSRMPGYYCATFKTYPQSKNPGAMYYVSAEADGARLAIQPESSRSLKVVAKLIEGQVPAGSKVILTVRNIRSAWLAESAVVGVWVDGQEVKDVPTLDTLAGEATRLRVIVPSSAKPGRPFTVRVVSLDRFWNPSSSTYTGGSLSIDGGAAIKTGIAFTGSYTTEASISTPGVYRVVYDGTHSNPIRVSTEAGLYWGDLHSHDKSHSGGIGEDPYTYARDVSGLDFLAHAPALIVPWKDHKPRSDKADTPSRFTAFEAFEQQTKTGHGNIIFIDSEGDADPERVRKALAAGRALMIPHHVGIFWAPQARGYPAETADSTPVLEIYSHHGLGEMYNPEHILSYEFNRVRLENKWSYSTEKPVYARDAWAQGRRIGVIASSDDHMAQPGKPMKGLAAVFAEENTRAALWNSLKRRKTYGTSGERILLDFRINGQPMGSELTAAKGNLTVDLEVNGTASLGFVEVARFVVRSGVWDRAFYEVFPPTWTPADDQPHMNAGRDFKKRLSIPFESDAIYYVRLAQQNMIDGWPAYAWSSPIWVTEKR